MSEATDPERPDDTPLRYDLQMIAGHATSEYGLSPAEIAETMKAMANRIEEDTLLSYAYHGANTDTADTDSDHETGRSA